MDWATIQRKLQDLKIAEPVHEGYDRKTWKHWADEDKDCQDTRQEVLIEESEVPVTFKTAKKCKVITGRWTCPYTGEVFTNPRELDVDHMVPIAAAHAAGGYTWDAERKQSFANDLAEPEHLIAVSASANRSKGKRSPDEWLPEEYGYICEYVQNWIAIKVRWELSASEAEQSAIEERIRFCDFDRRHPECSNSNDPLCGL